MMLLKMESGVCLVCTKTMVTEDPESCATGHGHQSLNLENILSMCNQTPTWAMKKARIGVREAVALNNVQ